MAKPHISEFDLCRNAKRVGCSTAEIQTFLEVETKGHGFDDHDRPLILFERHWFHKFTKGQYDESHPHISNADPGGYGKSAVQWGRFQEAFALDPIAAMKSASWGLGQVMGFNYAIAGYSSVGEFVDSMKESEGNQLDAAINFVLHNDLDDELRRHDWKSFARGYNGSKYRINKYDEKLETAFEKYSKKKINCSQVSAPLPPVTTKIKSADDAGEVPQANSQPSDDPQTGAEQINKGIPPNDTPLDPAQLSGKDNIVIETHKPQTFWEYVWAKISALAGGELTLTLVAQKLSEFQGLGFSEKLVSILIGAAIIFGLIAFTTWFIAWWRKEHDEKKLTAQMVAENSASDNLVHFAQKEELPAWQKWGAIVIRRPEQGA